MTAEAAISKAKALMAEGKPFLMATVDAKGCPHSRWMGGFIADPNDQSALYLVCGANSRKITQIEGNPATELLFSAPDYACVVTLEGKSEVVGDAAVRRMVWEGMPEAHRHFDDPDSPVFGVVKFSACCLEVLCMHEEMAPTRVEW